MGLDMYLMKRKRFHQPTCADIKFEPGKGNIFVKEPESVTIHGADDIAVSYEAIYWRKANMAHKWFVDNIQGGKDDCGEYEVPIEKLEELLEICNKVLENHELASELLPTDDGFFFGGTEYDEYYFDKVKYTAEKLEEVLDDFKSEMEALEKTGYNIPVSIDFYYTSWW